MQNVGAQFIAIDSNIFVQEFLKNQLDKDRPDCNQHQSVIHQPVILSESQTDAGCHSERSEESQTPGTKTLRGVYTE
jgi:hypothetical protein